MKSLGFGYYAESFATLIDHVLPVLCCNLVLGEEFRTHADTIGTGLEPFGQILFGRSHAAGYHQFRPRQGSEHTLHHLWRKHVAREYLTDVASGLLCEPYLGDASASGNVGNKAAVAHLGHVGVEQRTYYEASPKLHVE